MYALRHYNEDVALAKLDLVQSPIPDCNQAGGERCVADAHGPRVGAIAEVHGKARLPRINKFSPSKLPFPAQSSREVLSKCDRPQYSERRGQHMGLCIVRANGSEAQHVPEGSASHSRQSNG